MNNKKILIIGKAESIHTARWINQLKGAKFEIHLFPSVDYGRSHSDLRGVDIYHSFYARVENTTKSRLHGLNTEVGSHWLRMGLQKIIPNYRRYQLIKLIKELKPDIIHAIEFQAGAYLAIEAKKRMSSFPPLWITNWGSDVSAFINNPHHHDLILEVFKQSNYYSCECSRDVILAKKLGFKGTVLRVIPNAGGYKEEISEKYAKTIPSKRKGIMVKGYQGWAGRALVILNAIDKLGKQIAKQNYQLILYSSGGNRGVNSYAKEISKKYSIPLKILPPHTSHNEILKNHGRSRISIGMSMSDGISTSILEAMSVGSFPIQSYTSCADEWTLHGKTSLLVPPEDVDTLASAIKVALSDDELVDKAAVLNMKTIKKRANYKIVKDQVLRMYNQIV